MPAAGGGLQPRGHSRGVTGPGCELAAEEPAVAEPAAAAGQRRGGCDSCGEASGPRYPAARLERRSWRNAVCDGDMGKHGC